jgi:hypothetical protein
MHFVFIEREPESEIDNGITGYIATLGGVKLGPDEFLLKTSMGIEQLRVALEQHVCAKHLRIRELAGEREAEALRVQWLGAEVAATEPPLVDYLERHGRR